MRGTNAGVQAKVKAVQPSAIYSHCYAHCVDLVLVESTSTNQYTRKFFDVLQNLYAIFLKLVHIDTVNLNHSCLSHGSKVLKKYQILGGLVGVMLFKLYMKISQLLKRYWKKLKSKVRMAELLQMQVDSCFQ